MNKEQHLSDLMLYYTAAEAGYSEYRDDFYKLLDIYRGVLPEALLEDLAKRQKSHIAYKKAKAIVNRYAASVRATYFTNDQFANVISYKKTEEEELKALRRQEAFDYHWKHTIKAYVPFCQCIHDSGIYGTPIAKVYYDSAKDTPRMERVSVHDCWFDPDAVHTEDLKFLVHRYRKSRADIRSLKKAGVFNSRFLVDSLSSSEEADNAVARGEETPHSRITLYDVYYKKDNRWYLSTIHGKSTILRSEIELQDGLPFIVGGIMEQAVDNRERAVAIYSDTFLSSIDTIQMELTARVNQQLDAIDLNNHPKYITETGTGLNDADMRSGAGKQVRVTDMTRMQIVPPPPVPLLNADIDRLSMQMEESTGVKSIGSADSALINRQTENGMEILTADRNVMVESYTRSFNETFAEPLVKRFIELIWKHSKRAYLFEGVSRTVDDDFFVSINAGLGATSKAVKLQGNERLFQQFMALGDADNAKRTIKDSLPLYGKKNITQYFPSEDGDKKAREEKEMQMMQMQEQRMQLELADLQAKVKENETQAQSHIAQAEESKINSEIKVAKAKLEMELMMKDFDLRKQELEFKYEQDVKDFDIKERELLLREDEMINRNLQGATQ